MKSNLSIIICSTNVQQAHRVCQNIQQTSGLDCEFFIHDNNFFNWSLAKTYNTYAKLAKSDYLLLCHQDIEFVGDGWGKKIVSKLKQKRTGVIGFAGSVIKLKDCYSGWALNIELSRNNYCYKDTKHKIYHFSSKPFDDVVVIDGLAMFVRREVALANPFDEAMLPGFHCYDLDFSMSLFRQGFKNYVFTDEDTTVIHYSPGNYDKSWAEQTKMITDLKWSKFLPLQTEEIDQKIIAELTKKKNDEFELITNGRPEIIVDKPKASSNNYQVEFNKCSIYSTWI